MIKNIEVYTVDRNRLFAYVTFKGTTGEYAFSFYQSSGMNKKAGKRWGGEWFPILATMDTKADILDRARLAYFGEGIKKQKSKWICKGRFDKCEADKYFGFKQLKLIADTLTDTTKYDKEEVALHSHQEMFNKYQHMMSPVLNLIANKYEEIRRG